MPNEAQMEKLQQAILLIDQAITMLIDNEMSTVPFIREARERAVEAVNAVNRIIQTA